MTNRSLVGFRRNLQGVAARLLGAVIVPLVLLALVATWVAAGQLADQQKARVVEIQVSELVTLVDLNTAIFNERLLINVDQDLKPGSTAVADLEQARKTTEDLITAVPLQSRVVELSDIVRVRQIQDAGTVSAPVVDGRYHLLTTRLSDQISEDVVRVREAALELGDDRLAEATLALDRTIVASTSGTTAMVDLIAYLDSRAFEQSIVRSRLARSSQDFERASDWLTANATGPVGAAWSDQKVAIASLDGQVTSALEGFRVPTNGSTPSFNPKLNAAAEQLPALPPIAAAVTSQEADRLYNDALQSAIISTILGVALIIFSALTAFGFARSIMKPTSRFTQHARAMGRGDLDVEPLPLSGPSEFVAASRAFNDLVANLQLVHKKAMALAQSNLDAPVLSEPLTGPLGETIRQSIQVLSESILQRERLQYRLTHEATHDSLVGIANRAAAISHLEIATSRAKRRGSLLAVVFIDLDDFKRVNDTYGHAAGDELLREIGRRMSQTTRDTDLLARLGGDEFLLVAEDFKDVDEVVMLARRLIDVLSEPILVDDLVLTASACAGVAIGPQGDDPLTLLQHADLAVYEAKNLGSGSIHMYDEDLQARLRARTDTEDALSKALSEDDSQFHLVYQPILDSITGQIERVEALLRWNRPDVGLVAPDLFIPIAEGSSLILEIDRWVLEKAFRQLEQWKDHPILSGISLAVNISGRHILDSNFVTDIVDATSKNGADPRRVIIEVTETVLVEDLDVAAAQLQAVRDLGVRVAVDDFGTGYTSISHLRKLPIDSIKIDRSFVQGLPEASDDLSLIRMVNELAGHLGIPTVAEGVETDAQCDILRQIGCDFLQGYLFSPPLAPDALVEWLEHQSTQPAVAI